MTKPSETDVLLVQLTRGATLLDLIDKLGLDPDTAEYSINARNRLIATYGEEAFK